MGETAAWYLFLNGQQQGPMTEFQVNEMIRGGQVAPLDKAVGPQHPDWTPIKDVMAFAPLVASLNQQEQLTAWIVSIDGVEQAPEPEATVSDRIRAGQIPDTALVRGPSTPEWTQISKVIGFAALYRGFGGGPNQRSEQLANSPVGEDEPWMQLPGWHQAYKGLSLFYKAILLAILLVLLMIALPLVILLFATSVRGEAAGVAKVFTTLMTVIRLGWITAAGLMLVGLIYYTRLPPETGARGLATMAMALLSVALLVTIYTLVVGLLTTEPSLQAGGAKPKAMSASQILISATSGASSILGLILLLTSMMKAAAFIGQDTVATKARNTVILAAAIIGIQIAYVVVVMPMLQQRGAGGGLIGFVLQVAMAILAFICLGMFISTVNGMRTALMVAET